MKRKLISQRTKEEEKVNREIIFFWEQKVRIVHKNCALAKNRGFTAGASAVTLSVSPENRGRKAAFTWHETCYSTDKQTLARAGHAPLSHEDSNTVT